MSQTIIVDPTAEGENKPRALRRTLDGLRGRIVGFIDDSKLNFNHLADDLSDILANQYGVAKIIKRRKLVSSHRAPESVLAEKAAQCDVVITGSGD